MLHFKNVVKEGLWLSFFFLQAFALAETIQKEDVVKRLDAIKSFIPAKNYVWDLKFTEGKNVFYGKLQGNQFDVTLNVPAGSLTFDKRSPEKVLWNGKTMLVQNWFEPLWNQSGCCYGVLGMPFLNWPIQSFKTLAKRGRRCVEVVFENTTKIPLKNVKAFIDYNFNYIMEIELLYQEGTTIKFILQRLKKHNNTWGIQQADFYHGKLKTTLDVVSVN